MFEVRKNSNGEIINTSRIPLKLHFVRPMNQNSSSRGDATSASFFVFLTRLNELRNLAPEVKRKSMLELFKEKMVDEDFVFENVNGNSYGFEECSKYMIIGKTAMKTLVEVTRRIFIPKDSVSRIIAVFVLSRSLDSCFFPSPIEHVVLCRSRMG